MELKPQLASMKPYRGPWKAPKLAVMPERLTISEFRQNWLALFEDAADSETIVPVAIEPHFRVGFIERFDLDSMFSEPFYASSNLLSDGPLLIAFLYLKSVFARALGNTNKALPCVLFDELPHVRVAIEECLLAL